MGRDSNMTGWVAFAAILLIIRGVLEGIAGLTALLKNNFYLVREESLLVFDFTTWGWINLLIGLVLLWTGVSLLHGANWARVVAIFLASMALIANLLFITAYPLWSILAVVLYSMIIYGLTVKGDDTA